ncbi:MAG: hypothetical protein M1497_05570 [Nitrospirae bacterium]|nr:hypothetical protein [Nitrospirota bacterium]
MKGSAKRSMVFAKDYRKTLRKVAREFFVSPVRLVDDIASWAKEKGIGLREPAQPLRLSAEGKRLVLYVQEEIPGKMLEDMMQSLSVRWSLIDNVSDPAASIADAEKRLVYCFLKEYAGTVEGVAGDEHLEDNWAIREMKKLGFFGGSGNKDKPG